MRDETLHPKNGLVTIGELAEYLHLTPRAVYKLIRRQKLGEKEGLFRPGGREYRIDMAKFLRARGIKIEMEVPHADDTGGVIREVLGNLMPLHTQLSHIAASVTQLGEDI